VNKKNERETLNRWERKHTCSHVLNRKNEEYATEFGGGRNPNAGERGRGFCLRLGSNSPQ